MDDNAPAYDHIRIRTRDALASPRFAAFLGSMTIDLSAGILPSTETPPIDPRFGTDGEPVVDPKLLAMRVAFRPRDWLEFGMSRNRALRR